MSRALDSGGPIRVERVRAGAVVRQDGKHMFLRGAALARVARELTEISDEVAAPSHYSTRTTSRSPR